MQRPNALIITALKEEYDEALKVDTGAYGPWAVTQVAGFDVAVRTYHAVDGRSLRVALTWATRMRTTATAGAAGRLIDKFKPQCLAMCGVCAGRRGKVHPGDVLLANLLYTYDTGSLRAEYDDQGQRHERFQADPDPYPLDERLLRCAQTFKVATDALWLASRPPSLEAQGNWLLERLRQGQDPQKHPERGQRCPAWMAVIERLRKLKRVTKQPPLALTSIGTAYIDALLLLHPDGLPDEPALRIHIAPIATGNNVIRDPKIFDRLSVSMREVLGVEMEAAAIGAIAHAHGIPWVVMKAAMDFADHDKDDQFKPFASRASAECLIAFLRDHLPIGDTIITSELDTEKRSGGGPSASASEQMIRNYGPVGQQINVQGGATLHLNLGVSPPSADALRADLRVEKHVPVTFVSGPPPFAHYGAVRISAAHYDHRRIYIKLFTDSPLKNQYHLDRGSNGPEIVQLTAAAAHGTTFEYTEAAPGLERGKSWVLLVFSDKPILIKDVVVEDRNPFNEVASRITE